jgi:14-3-3 protein epsilon
LSVAYKNSVGSRRTAWRTISAIQNKEEYKVQKSLFFDSRTMITKSTMFDDIGIQIFRFDKRLQTENRERT